jgi:hypothetical protein
MHTSGIYPTSRFIRWLFATKRVRTIADPGNTICIALYFDATTNRWTHAAIRQPDGRAISKWGAYAVYDHAIQEVPTDYGDDVYFVEKPADTAARELFATYVQRCLKFPRWAR